MHLLARDVRFSFSPFCSEQTLGFNAYASRPAGEGLALFLELRVHVAGPVDPDTGFLLDVGIIDAAVRRCVVPLFIDCLSNAFCRHRHVGLRDVVHLLDHGLHVLSTPLRPAHVTALGLNLNPYQHLALHSEDPHMVFFSEKFEFAAMHKLWNHAFSDHRNLEVFGKCANPSGHGHNYIVEVTVSGRSTDTLDTPAIEKAVHQRVIQWLDHKNLNADVPYFLTVNPTMERIAEFAWNQLADHIDSAKLSCITVWESDRTRCSYYGPDNT